MTSNDTYVLELLRKHNVVSFEQVEHAKAAVDDKRASVVDILMQQGVVDEADILAVIAGEFGMQFISLEDVDIPREVREAIPAEIALRYRVVPVSKSGAGLLVAVSDPLDFDTLDTLGQLLKCHVEGAVARRAEVKAALDRYYPSESSMEAMLSQIPESALDITVTGGGALTDDSTATESDAPIIKYVYQIILAAFRNRASDIHLEPMEHRFRVRFRIDGVLHEVENPPKRLQGAIVSRVKLMAGMKLSEKRLPQDGRIQVNALGRELDLRVSTVPGNHGECAVMRILDKQNLALGLPKLGFFSDDQQTFDRLLTLSDGIILVTGPTGSGKTTTLYACLSAINRPDRKIITVEDPVEYLISGVNQVHVKPDIHFTFAAALRSILRQAPNVIMIGEIRDLETANIAMEASLTGHLVFSTLHTNDAPSAVSRLIDIGVKPFLVASSLRAVMAQRLVRCICDECREEYAPTRNELQLLGPAAREGTLKLSRGRGCRRCAMTGYYGRRGIFEIFLISEEIQRMIFERTASFQLRARARELGMRSLREDGLRKVVGGITTLEEVFRVTLGDTD